MRFARVGNTNSKLEADAVVASVAASGGENRSRFTVLVRVLRDLEAKGLIEERAKWIATTQDRVFVYTGDSEGDQFSGSKLRIWAAVEVDSNGRLVTLLKLADGYRGETRVYADYETEAFERLAGGRFDGED